MPEVIVERSGPDTTVIPRGALTVALAQELRSQIRNVLSEGVSHVVFDLSGTEVVDSSGIGLLIATHNSLKKTGGSLRVVGVSPEIKNLFKAMRLDRHFAVEAR
ncbi:MAG: STAS domain-containing protein [Syntrophobacteraceae bacterium]|jgi:anti-anti-sigma factor|nr:STAS domain-containing protein [Syntrophobacteraceae bacterium]